MLATSENSKTARAPHLPKPKKPEKLSARTRARLKHLRPVPVSGPDSALLETWNRFLKAWADYYVEAETNPEASVSAADALAFEIVEMPARTAQGMLLKLDAAASQMGETGDEFPFGGKDFQYDTEACSVARQIEYQLLLRLRDDLRRMPTPAVPLPAASVSDDLAALLSIWRDREHAVYQSIETARALVDHSTEENRAAAYRTNCAISAVDVARKTIFQHPARTLQDVMAKFAVVKDDAELEDINSFITNPDASGTESMLWSICADLIALSGQQLTPAASPIDAGHVASPVNRLKSRVRRDPIFKAVAEVESCRLRYVAAEALFEEIKKGSDLKFYERARVFLSAADMMVIGSIAERGFIHPNQIDQWAKKWIALTREQIRSQPNRRWAQGTRTIKRIRELKPLLKAALAKQSRRVEKYRRSIGFNKAYRSMARAENRLAQAENKAYNMVPTTSSGLVALFDFVKSGAEANYAEGGECTKRIGYLSVADALTAATKAMKQFGLAP